MILSESGNNEIWNIRISRCCVSNVRRVFVVSLNPNQNSLVNCTLCHDRREDSQDQLDKNLILEHFTSESSLITHNVPVKGHLSLFTLYTI